MVQSSDRRAQWIVSLAPGIICLLRRHPTIESVTIPTARLLVLHSRGKPCSTSKLRGVKTNTTKLCGRVVSILQDDFSCFGGAIDSDERKHLWMDDLRKKQQPR
jgi:hypothetical protein